MSERKFKIRKVKNGIIVTFENDEYVYQNSSGFDEGRKEAIQDWKEFIHVLTENFGPEYDKWSQFNYFSYVLPGWKYDENVTDKDVQQEISMVALLCGLEKKYKESQHPSTLSEPDLDDPKDFRR